MSEPLDEMYFKWLCSQVGDLELNDPTRTYWRLMKQLHTKEFVWFVPNDDNRIGDGKELRYEFVDQSGLADVDLSWLQLGCSMLELMVGMSRRLAFVADGEPRVCFWILMENAGLLEYVDGWKYPEEEVEPIIDRLIWRTYDYDGRGGFFPLKEPKTDQREVELWYQMNAYVIETT